MDELGAEVIDESIRQKLVAAAIWTHRCEPEGRYMGTEFGEVGNVQLAFDGHWTIAMLQVRTVMDLVARSHDSVLVWLE